MASLKDIIERRGTSAPVDPENNMEQGPQLPKADELGRIGRMQLAATNPKLYSDIIAPADLETADRRQGQFGAGALNFVQGGTGMLLDDMLSATDAAASYVLPQSMMPSLAEADLENMGMADRFNQSSDYFNTLFDQTEENYPVAAYGGQIAGALTGLPGKAAEKIYNTIRPQGFGPNALTAMSIGGLEAGGLAAAEGARGTELADSILSGTLFGLTGAGGIQLSKYLTGDFGTKTRKKLQELFGREGLEGLKREELKTTGAEQYLDEAPEAADMAAQAISRMNTTDPIEQERLAELRQIVREDTAGARGQLESIADRISDVETATQRAARLNAELASAKGDYDQFIASNQGTAIPKMDLVRAVNWAFFPAGKQTVLSTKAEKVRQKWQKQIADMAARSPNEAIPLSTLLDMRKDISALLNAQDSSKLGSAYPKLTAAVDKIDGLINDRTSGLYSVVNDAYKTAYTRDEAFKLGSSMFGAKYSADDANFWIQQNPKYTEEFGYGMRSAMATNLRNGNIRAGLRNLLGDELEPLKVSPQKYNKLKESIGPQQAQALKSIYETYGPRLEALTMLDDVITGKLSKPDLVDMDPNTLADRMVVQHALLTGNPLGVAAGRGTAGAASRVLTGAEADSVSLPLGVTNQAIDTLMARGGPYREGMSSIMERPPVAASPIVGGVVGGLGAAQAPLFSFSDGGVELGLGMDSLLNHDQ